MDLARQLKQLETLETKFAELYTWIADQLPDDRRSARVFRKLAREEKLHAMIVKHQRQIVNKNPVIFKETQIDLAPVVKLCKAVEHIMSSTETITAEQAVQLAIRLESDAMENHLKNAAGLANPALAEAVKQLGSADDEHLERLVELGLELGCLTDKED